MPVCANRGATCTLAHRLQSRPWVSIGLVLTGYRTRLPGRRGLAAPMLHHDWLRALHAWEGLLGHLLLGAGHLHRAAA